MNHIKRIFSCFSVLAVCILANMGIEAKAITSTPVTNIISSKFATDNIQQQNQFTLHNGTATAKANERIADHYSHYSHSSHVSHQSHFSSRY